MKMTKKLKRQWIAALRSGDYEQGTDALCQIDGKTARYCCLGVLAEVVHGEDAWSPTIGWNTLDINGEDRGVFGEEEGLFSSDFENWVAKMNDGGDSFEEIADYIEKQLKV